MLKTNYLRFLKKYFNNATTAKIKTIDGKRAMRNMKPKPRYSILELITSGTAGLSVRSRIFNTRGKRNQRPEIIKT